MSLITKIAEKFRCRSDQPDVESTTKEPTSPPKPSKRQSTPHRSDKNKPSQSRQKFTAYYDGLVDIVEEDGQPLFLVCENGQLRVEEEVVLKGKTLKPPPIDRTPFPLSSAQQVVQAFEERQDSSPEATDSRLFEDVRTYLHGLSELPSEEHYDLCAAWIMHTYRIEQVQFSPIMWLFGVPERGKTRTGKGMVVASFRGLHVECLNQAYFLRVAQDCRGALFIDAMDAWKRAEKAESADILLLRFDKGALVPRVTCPEKGPFEDTQYFNIFGPTILGTNRGVDPTLESRSIRIIMPESTRLFDNFVTPEAANELRVQLLAYRAQYLSYPLPVIEKPFTGRFGDIVRPICQIVLEAAPDRMPSLMTLLERIRKERLASKSESFEASVLEAIVALADETVNGTLPVKRITEQANTERPESRKLTPQRIGKVVKSMGLQTRRAAQNGASVLVWEEEKLQRLLVKYGLDETSVRSESSVSDESSADLTEVTEVTEPPATIDLPF